MPDTRLVTTATGQQVPLGNSRCLCSGCKQVFSSVSGFDRHQTLTDGCLTPHTRGLVHGPDGVWHMPSVDTPPADDLGRYELPDPKDVQDA